MKRSNHVLPSMKLRILLVSCALLAGGCASEAVVSPAELPTVAPEQPASSQSTPETNTTPSETNAGDTGSSDTGDTSTSTDETVETVETVVGGTELLLEQCEAGSDMACDILLMNSEDASVEEDIASRCGGRSDKQVLFCTEGIDHKGRDWWFEEDSEGLPRVVTWCQEGDMTACDWLFERAEAGSEYEAFGDGCAGRTDVAIPDCRTLYADEYGLCPIDLPGGCSYP